MSFADDLNSVAKPPQQVQAEEKKKAIELGKMQAIMKVKRPVWKGGRKNEEDYLQNCYYNSMQVAMDHGIRTIAFPSISTGIYHFPVELAAKIAVHTVTGFLSNNEGKFDLVEWVLFDENTEKVYEREVEKFI